jgi:hypothetical protein
MTSDKFNPEYNLKKEAINFIKSRIGIAFTNAEKRGKITGLNSLFDFREEMEEQFIDFIEEYFRKRDQLIKQQQELIRFAKTVDFKGVMLSQLKQTLNNKN